MWFQLVSDITGIRIIASGSAIRERNRLRKVYGPGRWRKLAGHAIVRLPDGSLHTTELHWYEAHGIGKRELKLKRLLESLG